MDISATATLPCSISVALAEVGDLSTYPSWLSIVQSVTPLEEKAWTVRLGARVGVLGRTKAVRMVEVVADPPTLVRFERRELDGREHSPWVLEAALVATAETTTDLTMHLHYGGSRWLPLLDLVLAQEIRRAGARLAARVVER